jgi:hypothetical protein
MSSWLSHPCDVLLSQEGTMFASVGVSQLPSLLLHHAELEGHDNDWKSTHLHVRYDKQINFFTLVSRPCLVLPVCHDYQLSFCIVPN